MRACLLALLLLSSGEARGLLNTCLEPQAAAVEEIVGAIEANECVSPLAVPLPLPAAAPRAPARRLSGVSAALPSRSA